MAHSLELERSDWTWPGRAYLTDSTTRISARRIEYVDITEHTLRAREPARPALER